MNFIWYLFIACCVFQIVYQFILVFSIIKFKKNQTLNLVSQNQKSVSVIICAKNEHENLQKNLPFILNQKYPNFEVIVVDDGSDDQLTIDDERLTIIRIPAEEKIGLGKKYALQKGIERATNEIILLTDADCKPNSGNWIAEMATLINEKHKIVLGISPYYYEPTFLNSAVEYETAQTALQYLGFAILGLPYMSVGRNVCYDAQLLKSKIWNKNELAIASGDDDLAIQSLATKENTTVCLAKESYTYSQAKNSWKSWFHQKTRHAESGFLYKFQHKFLLGSYMLTKIGMYVFFITSCFFLNKLNVFCFLFLIITITIFTILNMLLNKKLCIQKRWYFSFFLDLIYTTMIIITGLLNLFQSTRKWK